MSTASLVGKIVEVSQRVELDLSERNVLTEAATGAYAVTPVIAAFAGATVTALAKSTNYGSVDDVRRQVLELANELGVAKRIQIVESLSTQEISAADIVTNSGHLRPLNAAFIRQMKPGAAIPLMYESWELRAGEVDLEACKDCGIRVAGTNECHPNVRVLDYLGMLALHGLFQCGVPVCFSRILLICDNPFAPHIAAVLSACQAEVFVAEGTPLDKSAPVRWIPRGARERYDGVILADTPSPSVWNLGLQNTKYAAEELGDFDTVIQVWGDVDRAALPGIRFFPRQAPARGHMGVLLSDLGPEPVLRLQAGGLKVAEILTRNSARPKDLDYCQLLLPGDF